MFWHRRVITLFPNCLQFLSCLFEKHFGNFLANFYPLDWEKSRKIGTRPQLFFNLAVFEEDGSGREGCVLSMMGHHDNGSFLIYIIGHPCF
jgi:hypothetical protein